MAGMTREEFECRANTLHHEFLQRLGDLRSEVTALRHDLMTLETVIEGMRR